MKIVMSAVLALFLIGCGEGSKQETQSAETKQPVSTEVKVEEAVAPAVEKAQEAVEKAQEAVAPAVEKVEEAVAPAVEKAQETVAEVKEEVKEVVTPATTEVKSVNVDGIYRVCATCHGSTAEKPALGKSQIIKGWSAEKIEAAINGYKDGTYGGTMKGVMTNQVAKLTPEEIKAVAEHISKF